MGVLMSVADSKSITTEMRARMFDNFMIVQRGWLKGGGLFLLSRIEVEMMHVVLFAVFYFWNRIFCAVKVERISLYAHT